MNKTCRVCGEVKLTDEFHDKRTECKECGKARARDWYIKNQAYQVKKVGLKNKERKLEATEWIRQQKSKPCTDCGIQYPYYVMQFDHLRDKKFTISLLYSRGWSKAKIQEEIDKCEVVCANCHFERTHQRRTISLTGKAAE